MIIIKQASGLQPASTLPPPNSTRKISMPIKNLGVEFGGTYSVLREGAAKYPMGEGGGDGAMTLTRSPTARVSLRE
jgi:hypothetical protein